MRIMRHKFRFRLPVFLLVISMWIGMAGAHVVRAAPVVQGPPSVVDHVAVDLEMPFPEDPEQVGELLQRIRENAIDIQHSEERIMSFVDLPSESTWLTHAWRLNRAEEGLEDMQRAIDHLDERTDMLLKGQKEAFALIQPAAETLAVQLNEQVERLSTTRSSTARIQEQEARYIELAGEIRDRAEKIVDATRLAESLSEVREQLEALESHQ